MVRTGTAPVNDAPRFLLPGNSIPAATAGRASSRIPLRLAAGRHAANRPARQIETAGAAWHPAVVLELARPERFELPTPKFVAWYSIQLSYGRVAWMRIQPRQPAGPRIIRSASDCVKYTRTTPDPVRRRPAGLGQPDGEAGAYNTTGSSGSSSRRWAAASGK